MTSKCAKFNAEVDDYGNAISIAIVDVDGMKAHVSISIDEAKQVLSNLCSTLKVAEDVRLEQKQQLIQEMEQSLQVLRRELRDLENEVTHDS